MRIFTFCILIFATPLLFGQTHFYVANRDGNNVLRFSMDGIFIEEFVNAGSGNLSSPQEVLFHPIDGSLLVTGFNNTRIKQYDGQSGAFLGDFTNGFDLDHPTKMNIGSDSLLYVAQWGNPQSKIIRFDLDGDFVDEWSEVDVREGCGMEWDSEGSLYVTTWSDGQNNGTAGFVRKFAPDGSDLGIIINSTILQGPVGLWIDESDVLFVIDWTLGRVSKFNTDGIFLEHFITGMIRTEGDAIGPDGKYYLCDWQANRVNRYNSDGSFDTTLVDQGLTVPNGITFGPDGIVSSIESVQEEIKELSIYPNPVTSSTEIVFQIQDIPQQIKLRIVDHLQREIQTITEGRKNKGVYTYNINTGNLTSGIFYVILESEGYVLTQKMVVVK